MSDKEYEAFVAWKRSLPPGEGYSAFDAWKARGTLTALNQKNSEELNRDESYLKTMEELAANGSLIVREDIERLISTIRDLDARRDAAERAATRLLLKLGEAEKLRDEWCDEYTKLRDESRKVVSMLAIKLRTLGDFVAVWEAVCIADAYVAKHLSG